MFILGVIFFKVEFPFNIRGIFGDPLRVPLVSVNIKMRGDTDCENVADGILIVCAIAPLKDVTHDAVLPLGVVADLQQLPVMNVMSVKIENTNGDDEECEDSVLNTDQLLMSDNVGSNSSPRCLFSTF